MNKAGMKVGDRFESKNCGMMEVIAYRTSRQVDARFDATGYVVTSTAANLRNGGVKDKLLPNVHGVGFFGDGEYGSHANGKLEKAYSVWVDMLKRCYSAKFHERNPTYIGCTVHSDWHNYQTFAKWHEENYTEGYHLDKDLLVEGNKVYGPDACVFVTSQLNLLFIDHAAARGEHPIGVNANHGRFQATINIEGKRKYLGRYDTPEAAHASWAAAKAKEIVRQANLKTTPSALREALIARANELLI